MIEGGIRRLGLKPDAAWEGLCRHSPKLWVAFAGLGASALYFRQITLVLAGAALVYRALLPQVMKRREGRDAKRLRQEMTLWMEELTIELRAGKSLSLATMELALRLTEEKPAKADKKMGVHWRHCLGLIRLNYPIAMVYQELARGFALPEMRVLASLVGSAVATGANLPQVFVQSALRLREQLESKETLESMLAAKRAEGCMLAAAPVVYTALLRFVSPAYMEPLYIGYGWIPALVVFALQLCGCHLFFRLLLREEGSSPDLDLAGFQEEIALHLQAGLSLTDAWRQAVYSRAGEKGSGDGADAGREDLLSFAAKQLAMGVPLSKTLEGLAKERGGGTELKRLAELLLRNYQSGGGSLAMLLSTEAKETRQKCLLDRRAKDGKRETALLFPMILLLLSALILTAAPALLSV